MKGKRQTRVCTSVSAAVGKRFKDHCDDTGEVRSQLLEELITRHLDGLDRPPKPTTEERLDALERRQSALHRQILRIMVPMPKVADYRPNDEREDGEPF